MSTINPYVWEISAEPAKEPVSLEEAKQHLRIDSACTTDDEYILAIIKAARRWCEMYQGRAYFTQTQKIYFDCFPSWDIDIDLPNPPLLAVSSITYVDTAGSTQTLATSVYDVDTVKEPGRVFLKWNQFYPATRAQRKAVTIEYTCGYGTDTLLIPNEIKQAILIVMAHLYEFREMVVTGTILREIPMSAKWLLSAERVTII